MFLQDNHLFARTMSIIKRDSCKNLLVLQGDIILTKCIKILASHFCARYICKLYECHCIIIIIHAHIITQFMHTCMSTTL